MWNLERPEMRKLFDAIPDLEGAVLGEFKYSSRLFAARVLSKPLLDLADQMADGLNTKRVFYSYTYLPVEMIHKGTTKFHKDGRRRQRDLHRILTYGGPPTIGREGEVLTPGTVWEYTGEFWHRAPTPDESSESDLPVRLMLRVSETSGAYTDRWTVSPEDAKRKRR